MKKIQLLVLVMCMAFALLACGTSTGTANAPSTPAASNQNTKQDENTIQNTTAPETVPAIKYFESDIVVNDFFAKYNTIATTAIEIDAIEKGNIKTKALVYTDSFNLEVINVNNGELHISIETEPADENTVMFSVFHDCIKAMSTLSDDEISNAWSAIHETGYMIEDYNINGILITYVPSKELSWGVNNPRVDLMIPVK